jgi:preprotein translocase subunit YajC
MKYSWRLLAMLVLPLTFMICGAQDLVSIIHGTIKKIDKDTKTVVIKTSDGTEHTIKVADHATVHGTEEGFDGLKEGSEVVARCSEKGADKTADDLGKVGEDGMKVTKGTVTKIDKDTKTLVVKSADGTEKTFEYTDDAAKDLGKSIGKGTQKGAKVTVYYSEESGKKVAHFLAS